MTLMYRCGQKRAGLTCWISHRPRNKPPVYSERIYCWYRAAVVINDERVRGGRWWSGINGKCQITTLGNLKTAYLSKYGVWGLGLGAWGEHTHRNIVGSGLPGVEVYHRVIKELQKGKKVVRRMSALQRWIQSGMKDSLSKKEGSPS